MPFGPLTDETQALIASITIDELDAIGERLLTAESLEAALGRSIWSATATAAAESGRDLAVCDRSNVGAWSKAAIQYGRVPNESLAMTTGRAVEEGRAIRRLAGTDVLAAAARDPERREFLALAARAPACRDYGTRRAAVARTCANDGRG